MVGVGVGVEPGSSVGPCVDVVVGVGLGVRRDVAEGVIEGVGTDGAVPVPGPGVEVAVGISETIIEGVMLGVPAGIPVPGGVLCPVGEAETPGGRIGRVGVAVASNNPPGGSPLAINGLGWTILVTSRNQALPSGAALPQPSAPS